MTGVLPPTLYHRWLGWHAPAMRHAITVLIAGLIVAVVLLPFVTWGLALSGGWDASALAFLLTHRAIIIRADSSRAPQLAAREDQTEGSATVLLVGASVASLLGAGYALHLAGQKSGAPRMLLIGAAVLTVVLSWAVGVGWAVTMALGQLPERHWRQLRDLLDYLESTWQEPDDGMWEARGPRRHYTQSKVMAWLAFDRAIALGKRFGIEGPLRHWEQIRAQIHDEILERAYDPQRRTFTQSYGSTALDAGALTVGLVGLLEPADDRFTTTIDVVRRELGHDGFISRYSTDDTDDGLSGSEGQFLACSFWLVGALALNGRQAQARELFERLLALRNDLGLYAEEYDVARGRQVGNFPQAFTHLALISAAGVLSGERTGTRSAPPAPLPRMPTLMPRRPAPVKLRRP